MPDILNRRDFLVRASRTALIVAAPAARRPAAGAATSLRIGVVGSATGPAASDRMNGLVLGVEEAQHAAAMFGGSVATVPVDGPLARAGTLSALLGDADEARCASYARDANAAGVPFLNIACASDRLRGPDCRASMFHVAPSEAMNHAAVALAGGTGDARAWDASLTRFGADTLNQRFKHRFGSAMTAEAWSAWFAVKVLWESSLRTKGADPRRLAEFLARDTAQFDGHKGQPLSFRAWDHQLRQPLYVRSGDRMTEVPPTTNADSPREALDRLGATAAESPCRLRQP